VTPAARVAAAIEVVESILDGQATEPALLQWARGSRYAGSKDRAAVRDLVFEARRKWASSRAIGGADTGRAVILGLLAQTGADIPALFSGAGYGPAERTEDEAARSLEAVDLSVAERVDMPDWLWARLDAQYGAQAEEIALSLRDRAEVFLRVNLARNTRDAAIEALSAVGIMTEPHALAQSALKVTAGARQIRQSTAYQSGLVELQDAASQALVDALEVTSGQSVLDYCAGGGGKALGLAANGARVTAHDISGARMADLPVRAERAEVEIALHTPDDLDPEARFDLVLCDAPCSGSGAWRRSPDGKWNLTEADLAEVTRTQLEVLQTAQKFVKPDGRLAYATCSILEAENDDTVASFVQARPEWQRAKRAVWLPSTGGDGFFLQVLERA